MELIYCRIELAYRDVKHNFVIFSLVRKKAGAVGVGGLFVNDDARAVSFFVLLPSEVP